MTIISPLIQGKNLQELIFGKEQVSCMFSYIFSAPYTCCIPQWLLIGEKKYILLQLCQALVFLHTSSPPLAHLDVKPANVMVRVMFTSTVTVKEEIYSTFIPVG